MPEVLDRHEKARARLLIFPVLQIVTDADLPAWRLTATDSTTLVQMLASIPDPRQARGRRHGLRKPAGLPDR